MNILQLKNELNNMGVPESYYAINGNLASNTYFLNQVYDKWEFFYFDEKGNQEGYIIFDDESEACLFLLDNLKNEMRYSVTTYKNSK